MKNYKSVSAIWEGSLRVLLRYVKLGTSGVFLMVTPGPEEASNTGKEKRPTDKGFSWIPVVLGKLLGFTLSSDCV